MASLSGKHRTRTEQAARTEVGALAWLRRFSYVLATFVAPGALTVWVGIAAFPSFETLTWYFWGGLAALVSVWLVFGALSMPSRFLASELYFDLVDTGEKLKREEQRNEALENAVVYLSTTTQAALGWFDMIALVARSPGLSEQEIVDDIVQPVAMNGAAFFGFQPDEHWTISVYRFDRADRTLRPVSRLKDQWNPAGDRAPRDWPPGVGHIGQAFSTGRPIITGNATAPDIAVFVAAPENLKRNGDDRHYVSFASIPIGPIDEGTEPWGVLVATSNIPDRFDEGNALILDQAAAALASAMETRHILTTRSSEGGSA
ncbi:GAF domain-containing protein [Rhodospira trueperi]|uniref:GAF domain-containing protein n=1 Tax=Rhodospira trueperi TaxID=69960 RepID=A0A1G6WGW0_9PROT|nr:GAF domain-containing protein [Rhodospira trueperi]SDD65190.1 GAF domain-containing protein [Rhodospira trueperi]